MRLRQQIAARIVSCVSRGHAVLYCNGAVEGRGKIGLTAHEQSQGLQVAICTLLPAGGLAVATLRDLFLVNLVLYH